MRWCRPKPAPDWRALLRAEVERDCAALLADGWETRDMLFLVSDQCIDRMEHELVEGIVAGRIAHEDRYAR